MERRIISQRIAEVLDDIPRLSNALYAMDTTDIQRYPDNYEVLSTDAALRAERIACRLRGLVYATTSVRKEDYLVRAAEAHGIEIGYEDGIMEITLPGLLPKKKQKRSSEFLLDPLHFALDRYADQHSMPRFCECVVCISHIYDQDLPGRRMLDYDNLQQKQFLDTIATFVMADDSGLLCDAYNTTELGEEDCTRIFIMDKSRFAGWLAERENSLKSISDF